MTSPQSETDRLAVAIDSVIPADDFPSASQAGGLRFWARLTESERPEWAARVTLVLDLHDVRSGGRFAAWDAQAREAARDGLAEDPAQPGFAERGNAVTARPEGVEHRRLSGGGHPILVVPGRQ